MKNSIESSLAPNDPLQKLSSENILIAFAGDVMTGRLVNEVLRSRDPASVWGNTLPLLKQADVRVVNFETALTRCSKKVPKVFHFKTDPENVSCLIQAQIDAVNLANNHILDYTVEGLFDSLAALDKSSIKHVGAGENISEARKPAILEKRGIRLGILGCTNNEPSWEAMEDAPGIFYVAIGEIEKIETEVSKLRRHVDLVVVSIHWGPNMRQRPTSDFRSFAHQIIDAGADIIHGHSAHIFQGIEMYHEKPILYDTGDFVDDYAVDPYLRNDCSFLFLVEANQERIISFRLVPVVIEDFSVHLAQGEEQEIICSCMERLSHEMGTEFTRTSWGLFKRI